MQLTPETCRKEQLLPPAHRARVRPRRVRLGDGGRAQDSGRGERRQRQALPAQARGQRGAKAAENQALKEAFQEANTFDNLLMQKTLAKGQVTKKRTLVETASAKRVNHGARTRLPSWTASAARSSATSRKWATPRRTSRSPRSQQENIEKVTCTTQKAPSGQLTEDSTSLDLDRPEASRNCRQSPETDKSSSCGFAYHAR
ncbi:hypothetical protein HPB49_015001 [Dermacentor silvarum]|uniref:Uncharacterized protein n=1 Tax=Dermacentor silvarum TaxID=543639 RepID=A0ACB8CFV9_DERSI|nr:hypothetical protein HPB49_015001 [Dermacentor silvarum]